MKTKLIEKTGLTVEGLLKVNELFLNRKWTDNKSSFIQPRYDNFCSTVTNLSPEELSLMIDLTERFNILNNQDLMEEFFCGFYNVPDEVFLNSRNILCVPLKKITPNGEYLKKQKSGDQILTEMEGLYKQYDYSDKIILCKTPEIAINKFIQNDILCFVDDFIGSGESYIEAYDTFNAFFKTKHKILNKTNVIAVCAWAMEQGVKTCLEKDLKVYSEKIFHKAISDYYKNEDLNIKKKNMKEIEEQKCKNQEQYSFGFHQCESLISINGKTVNNTFPIFWNTKNKTNTFPRY